LEPQQADVEAAEIDPRDKLDSRSRIDGRTARKTRASTTPAVVLRDELHQQAEGKGPCPASPRATADCQTGNKEGKGAWLWRTRATAEGKGKEMGMVAAAATARRCRNRDDGRIRRGAWLERTPVAATEQAPGSAMRRNTRRGAAEAEAQTAAKIKTRRTGRCRRDRAERKQKTSRRSTTAGGRAGSTDAEHGWAGGA
jgi:hypothetical protein